MANIFSRLFSSFKKETQTSPTKEILKRNEVDVYVDALRDCDKYLAKSDYLRRVDECADIFGTFNNLQETRMLEHYCTTNNCDIERVKSFIRYYQELKEDKNSSPIYKHNEKFISDHLVSEKSYLDGILSEVDPNIKLDDEQRKVVLSDEDYTLVIAGAGAGKTTTVSAKVKYLVERKGIRPDQILVISFTNKAVGELQDKINKALKIDCPVTTFHKSGYAIGRRQETEERVRIVTEGYMFNVVNDYLKHNILEYPELVDKLILFFGSYFDAPYEGDDLNSFFNYITKADFTSVRGNMDEYTEKVIYQRSGR